MITGILTTSKYVFIGLFGSALGVAAAFGALVFLNYLFDIAKKSIFRKKG